jgi:hypothetical protein
MIVLLQVMGMDFAGAEIDESFIDDKRVIAVITFNE